MTRRFAFLVMAAAILAGPFFPVHGGPTYDSPEAARQDGDFALQGEYSGEIRNAQTGESIKVGSQVIALGDGKFKGTSYVGGLPGDGWEGDTEQRYEIAESQAVNGVLTFQSADSEWSAIVKESQMHVYFGGNLVATLNKVERRSPTLGKQPPAGAVVLFDGSKESLKHWKEGAKITTDGLLMQGLTSQAKFGDHTIHVEFRLPYQPADRGQARGNSGLYLQGRYEVQMLDSFGLSGEDNECGGIYRVGRPRINMCYPPLGWQTYDVEFTAARFDASGNKTASARITVYHNGVKIHDNIEIPAPTAASPLKDEQGPGPVYLQDHGNPVRYRNIWVVEK